MKVIYVAGPYTAKTKEERNQNIINASKLGVKIWEIGMVPIVPHNNSRKFEDYTDKVSYEVYLNGGLELLRRCDAMIVSKDGFESSSGTCKEIIFCLANRIPILFSIDELERWGKNYDYTTRFSKIFYQQS